MIPNPKEKTMAETNDNSISIEAARSAILLDMMGDLQKNHASEMAELRLRHMVETQQMKQEFQQQLEAAVAQRSSEEGKLKIVNDPDDISPPSPRTPAKKKRT